MIECLRAAHITLATLTGALLISGCTASLPSIEQADLSRLPQPFVTISNIRYEGAFSIPDDTYGSSSANWAQGVIEVDGDALFLVGHSHDDAIAEFTIPALSPALNVDELPLANAPTQPFTDVLDRAAGGNSQRLDQIVGLELHRGKLFGNAIEYYDAPADNNQSTFVIEQGSALSSSGVRGFYSLNGKARAAGWLSRVPDEYRSIIGCSHISGNSSGSPIISRHSVGPSAFCMNLDELLNTAPKKTIRTSEMLGFSLQTPLHRDLTNDDGNNQLWTHLSQARYGFIVPGTRTYMTIGKSGGHKSGVGYKLKHGNKECPGYCATDPTDNYNYYWLWNMQELIEVRRGRRAASTVRPYESGEFPTPFQSGPALYQIGGGSYDESTGRLYLTLLGARRAQNGNINPPVIMAFSIRR